MSDKAAPTHARFTAIFLLAKKYRSANNLNRSDINPCRLKTLISLADS